MNRRMMSVKLMADIQPFTQLGCLSASQARDLVEDWKHGESSKLKALVLDPSLPSSLTPLLDNLKQYI
nr:hypothetical protein [uncultured Butyrivibrio sp.]